MAPHAMAGVGVRSPNSVATQWASQASTRVSRSLVTTRGDGRESVPPGPGAPAREPATGPTPGPAPAP
jgi:hypothetical protein